MTNAQIIGQAKAKLVADGRIKPYEELHTYKTWKKKGYQVYRGEKAIVALNIWQAYDRKGKDDDEDKPQETAMRIRKSYFFATHQVFDLKGEETEHETVA